MGDAPAYHLSFGKHKGRTLEEIPPDYRDWLIKKNVYANHGDLKAALVAGNYLTLNMNQLTPPPTPVPSTPSRKRQVPSDSYIRGSPSSRRRIDICKGARRNGTMLNYDGSDYILDFGKHAGEKLDDVPPDYIDYLIGQGIHHKRPDLMAALREKNLSTETAFETPLSSDQSTTSSSQQQSSWTAPSIHETNDHRFYDFHRLTPRWISDADARFYFGLEIALLSQQGIDMVTKEDLRRNAQYSELVPELLEGPKRWLYQVYKCAESFDSVPPQRGSADEALNDFLEKNQRREEEIRDAYGFQ